MTHCTSTAVALRFVCNAGSATFTTVPSMNAMLDARMVAVSTQRPRDFSHGAIAAPARTTFSSQGSRKSAHICANSVFAKCVVRKAIQPALAGLRGSDDRMTRDVRMFAGVAISRGVAAQCHAALLAGAEMNPRVADLHTLGAFANFRLLHGGDGFDVRANGHWFLTRASARCFLTALSRSGQCNLHAGDR